MFHRWIVRFAPSFFEDREEEIGIYAPRSWDIPFVLREAFPEAIVRGIWWVLPEGEE